MGFVEDVVGAVKQLDDLQAIDVALKNQEKLVVLHIARRLVAEMGAGLDNREAGSMFIIVEARLAVSGRRNIAELDDGFLCRSELRGGKLDHGNRGWVLGFKREAAVRSMESWERLILRA